ncbi:hypothetical protein Rleg10DRAFT_5762 [Rhizobium leguminosarum bv. trifolii WSM2012]|nr:hypothetical protein Rleg10DRAFT_4224 [Rhizobium leguminosarum bv. trifolii WSM2012]EJC77069.1 hypothetical protein Rleg10DRAFT_5762 [Rhizobium leguminosarum bv. trifolii WSM2012]
MVQPGRIGNSLRWAPPDEGISPKVSGVVTTRENEARPGRIAILLWIDTSCFRKIDCDSQGLMMRNCTAREAAAEIVAQPSLKRAVFR